MLRLHRRNLCNSEPYKCYTFHVSRIVIKTFRIDMHCLRTIYWHTSFVHNTMVFGSKTILGLKRLGSKKNLGPKLSQKPWVVHVSNFRPLVHPLLIYFGGGCSSCCCDRGKQSQLLVLRQIFICCFSIRTSLLFSS